MKKIFCLLTLALALCACHEEEFDGYDHPFVSIATETGEFSTVVLTNVNNINTYTVHVSSRPLTVPLQVGYEVVAGEGLTEGVDYAMLSQERMLTFEPGVLDMPVRVKWLAHPVYSADNTLTIRLVSVSQPMSIGMPGPAAKGRQLVIEKKN